MNPFMTAEQKREREMDEIRARMDDVAQQQLDDYRDQIVDMIRRLETAKELERRLETIEAQLAERQAALLDRENKLNAEWGDDALPAGRELTAEEAAEWGFISTPCDESSIEAETDAPALVDFAAAFELDDPTDIRAALAEGDSKAFTIEAYKGGIVNTNAAGPTVFELSGLALTDSVALLSGGENDNSAVIGAGQPVAIDGTLYVSGTIDPSLEPAAQVMRIVARGVRLQARMGAEIIEARRITRGDFVANGRTFTVEDRAVLLVTKAVLRHVAIMPNGMAGSAVNIAASDSQAVGA
jgi:hypothetical protein